MRPGIIDARARYRTAAQRLRNTAVEHYRRLRSVYDEDALDFSFRGWVNRFIEDFVGRPHSDHRDQR